MFKSAFQLIGRKEHLTDSGLRKLVAIKASMNHGLSDEQTSAFPEQLPVLRPHVKKISMTAESQGD